MSRFFVKGMLGSRPVSEKHYSVEIQHCRDAEVEHKYRRWHTISFYLQNTTPVLRTFHGKLQQHEFTAFECGIYPATQSEKIHWPGLTKAVHLHLAPHLLLNSLQRLGIEEKRYLPRYFCITDRQLYQLGLSFLDFPTAGFQKTALESLVLEICHHLAQYYCQPVTSFPAQVMVGAIDLDSLLNHMHDEYAVSNRVASLAEMTGLSVRQFSTVFKQKFGCSAHDYLLRSRIENAKHAIQTQSIDLTSIALQNGFFDHAHFTRTFKSRTGITPSHFADQLLG